MFEKEAKKWVKENTEIEYKASYGEFPKEPYAIKSFEAGAEFGYKKAKDEVITEATKNYNTIIAEYEKHYKEQIAELEKANKWHYVKDGDLPNTELGRADVTIAYINAYENLCKMDCCFDGTNFIYWNDRRPIGWKKADVFGKIYAWKYLEKLPELLKEDK